MAKAARPICFVDGSGGAYAVLAAAFARASGREAVAATSQAKAQVPSEVGAVLREIALSAGDVATAVPAGAERVDVEGWASKLFEGDGELERLSAARITRDKIERRVEALLATRAKR